MTHDDVLTYIDDIDISVESSFSCVVEAMSLVMEKENFIYQEAATKKKPGFFSKIFEAIKKIFRMIVNLVKKAIDKIKGFGNKASKKVNDIAHSVLSKESVVKEAADSTADVNVAEIDNIASGLYISMVGSDKISIEFNDAPMPEGKQRNFTSTDPKTSTAINKNTDAEEKRIAKWLYDDILKLKSMRKEFVDSFKKFVDAIKTNDASAIKAAYPTAYQAFRKYSRATIPDDPSERDKKYFEISVNDLTDYQKDLSEMGNIAESFGKDAYSTLDDEYITFFSNISNYFMQSQIHMNYFVNAIDMNTSYIAPRYRNKIHTPDKLGEFVSKCISSGILPKYVCYNAWLIADKNLTGSANEYDPVKGVSRMVFFPTDKSIVYKVAISGLGLGSNKNEAMVSKVLKGSPVAKYFALTTASYGDGAVITQERITFEKGNTPPAPDGMTGSKIQQEINKWAKEKNIPNPFEIDDLHDNNLVYDKKRGHYVILDYGMLYGNKRDVYRS